MTKFATKVTVVHRRDEFRASTIMAERVLDHPKIEVIWDTVVEEITGDSVVTGVTLRNRNTDEVTEFPTDGVFVAIGHDPNTSVFAESIELDDEGYIVTETGTSLTSVEGVYAAGDVTGRSSMIRVVVSMPTSAMTSSDSSSSSESSSILPPGTRLARS